MTMIATFNVNSIKARLGNILDWLKDASPDIVLLQEIKCVEEGFPAMEIGDLGYNVAVAGQKTYNGVAILSKSPIDVEMRALPGDDTDEQARYIEAFTAGVRVISVYVPNGNPASEGGADTEKFKYKLRWLDRLHDRARDLLATEDAVVIGGDYNVIPEPGDVHDPEDWAGDALYRPESRAAFRKILHLGYTEAFRALSREYGHYTWWDYRAGAWQKNMGARIDHLLLSPQAADRLVDCQIDKGPRAKEKASDHTPVWIRLRD